MMTMMMMKALVTFGEVVGWYPLLLNLHREASKKLKPLKGSEAPGDKQGDEGEKESAEGGKSLCFPRNPVRYTPKP